MMAAETTMRHDRHEISQIGSWQPRLSAPLDAGGGAAVELLRHLDPARLILYGGRRPGRDEWERHCGQRSEYVLVATSDTGGMRCVIGTLEFRIAAGEHGDRALIDRLYVDSRHRQRGIASRLLRAAIAFARRRGLASLHENIPTILIRDPDTGAWQPHVPAGEGWGGLRSLGATVNACVREGQSCAIASLHRGQGALRGPGERRRERIDATLALPIAPAVLAGGGRARLASTGVALLDRLLRDLAEMAGVALAPSLRASRTEAA